MIDLTSSKNILLSTGLFISIFLFTFCNSFSQVSFEPLNHQLKNFNSAQRIKTDNEQRTESSILPNIQNDIAGEERLTYRTYIPTDPYDLSVFSMSVNWC